MFYICVLNKLITMKKELLQIRLDEELLNQLKELANSNAISVSGQVRMLIKKAVKDDEDDIAEVKKSDEIEKKSEATTADKNETKQV